MHSGAVIGQVQASHKQVMGTNLEHGNVGTLGICNILNVLMYQCTERIS